MDAKVAEKFAQALAECAVRQNNVGLRKEAAAYQLIKQAEGDLRASPYIYGPAIGALLGGAGGYFSEDDEKKKLRNILYGAGIGGLTGLGVAGLGDAASRYFNATPGAAPSEPAADKKDAPKSDNKPPAESKPTERAKTDIPTATATVGGAAGGAVAGSSLGRRAHRYSLSNAANEVAAAPSLARRVMGAKQPTSAQQALAERMTRLQNYVDQAGGLRRVSDADLVQNSGLPAGTPNTAAARLRNILTGRAGHADFATAFSDIEAANPPPGRRGQPARPRFDASDVPARAVNAGRGRPRVRGGVGGIAGGLLGGWGANELSNARVPEAVGDTIGEWLANWRNSQ